MNTKIFKRQFNGRRCYRKIFSNHKELQDSSGVGNNRKEIPFISTGLTCMQDAAENSFNLELVGEVLWLELSSTFPLNKNLISYYWEIDVFWLHLTSLVCVGKNIHHDKSCLPKNIETYLCLVLSPQTMIQVFPRTLLQLSVRLVLRNER